MKKILMILMIALLTSCEHRNDAPIRFFVARNDWGALAIIAYERGYFEKQGLDVIVTYLPTGVHALEAMIAGSADIGTFSDANLSNYVFAGGDGVLVVAGINTSGSIRIMGRKDAGIINPEDLSGRRLAISPGTPSEIVADIFIEMHNLENVELVTITPPMTTSALISASVDAIVTWEPFLFNAERILGASEVVVFDTEEVFDFLLAVDRNFALENRSCVIKILKALNNAADFMANNVSEAQIIISEVIQVDLDVVQGTWGVHSFTVYLDEYLINRVIRIGEFNQYLEVNIGTPFPDFSVFFDFSFMEGLN